MKRFNRKTIIGFTIAAGLMGLLYFQSYKPLLNWSPVTPTVIVEMADTLYFDLGSASVQWDDVKILETIEKQSVGIITIIGGADSTGGSEKNWNLSLERANSVKTILLSLGCSPDSIQIGARGDFRPVIKNSKNNLYNRYTIIRWRKYQ